MQTANINLALFSSIVKILIKNPINGNYVLREKLYPFNINKNNIYIHN